MNRYVIERSLPGAGVLTDEEIRELSARSNRVVAELGDGISWVESFVGDNKLFCVYEADRPSLIREHAARGGFPCDSVEPVRTIISRRREMMAGQQRSTAPKGSPTDGGEHRGDRAQGRDPTTSAGRWHPAR